MWLEGTKHLLPCIRFEIESHSCLFRIPFLHVKEDRKKYYCNINFNFFMPNDNADCFDSSKIHEVIFSGAVVYGKLQL